MSTNRSNPLAASIAAALLASLSSAFAKPPQCTDTPAPASGPNGYYCVALDRSKIHSYCLRANGSSPRHVIPVKSDDDMTTESFVRVDNVSAPMAPDPCAISLGLPPKLAQGDIVRIAKAKNSDYLMQIWSSSGAPRFPAAAKLEPGTLGPNGERFYMTTTQLGVDYFVMLADDQDGQTTTPDVPVIEKYYEIEMFPAKGVSSACDLQRPDATDSNKTLVNFKRWQSSSDLSCTVHALQEAGSGSGGSNYP